MKMEVPISNSSSKVDICFSNSLESVKKNLLFKIVLHFIQVSTMTIMIPLDIYVFKNQTGSEEVLSFFIAALCTTLIIFLAKLSHYMGQLCNTENCLSIATDLNHVIHAEDAFSQRLSQVGTEQALGIVSQNIYNVQNNTTMAEVTPQIRASIEPALTNMIRSIALSRDPLTRCTINMGSIVSIGLFVFGVVVMAELPLKLPETIVIVLFLISQFLIEIQFFACMIFVAFIPLLCLFCCIFLCFCKQKQKQAQLPASVPADINIIQASEGSPCSICFQSIILQQQVIILPCSSKHVFHDKCISAWVVVKPNCPICRADLTQ